MTIEPFDLRMRPRHALVIDRLAHWYYVPREWIKKVALMDDVYLLNNPFTFQAMEKHSAYCAMIRLGLKVPDDVARARTSSRRPTSASPTRPSATTSRSTWPTIAERIGYPLFMKPFDGGAWVGVSQVRDPAELAERYDESGRRLMHLQRAVDGFDVFARSLSIGAETMVMRFEPDRPLHDRYQVDHAFLEPDTGREVVTIGRTVNAFFRWEFNSCETLIRDGEVHPIDYANACPDVSLISLHYYFPWAIKALVRWCAYCCVTGRRMHVGMDPEPWFAVGDAEQTYEEKLDAYRALADDYFEVEAYEEFCDRHLPHVDEAMAAYIDSPDVRRAAGRDRHARVPAARARALRRALSRPARRVGRRPALGEPQLRRLLRRRDDEQLRSLDAGAVDRRVGRRGRRARVRRAGAAARAPRRRRPRAPATRPPPRATRARTACGRAPARRPRSPRW